MRRRVAALAGVLAALSLAAPAVASAYSSPFDGQPVVGRTDMGIDFCLTPGDPIRAVGAGTVIGVMPNWYARQPYIWYQLSDGPQAGQYVYVAEQIDHLAKVGQTLHAGDVIARYAKQGSCLETGWSIADGEALAQATTGYTDGQATQAGVSFARFLMTLGVQGQFDLTVSTPPASRVQTATIHKRHRRHRAVPVPTSAPVSAPAPKPSPAPKPKPSPAPKPAPSSPPQTGSGPTPGPNFSPGNAPYWP